MGQGRGKSTVAQMLTLILNFCEFSLIFSSWSLSFQFRGACSRGKTVPSYQNDLIANALVCLNKIKRGIESNKFHEADMWCHVGTVIIREPDEGEN